MLYSENIKDYYLLDAGDSEKLEIWGVRMIGNENSIIHTVRTSMHILGNDNQEIQYIEENDIDCKKSLPHCFGKKNEIVAHQLSCFVAVGRAFVTISTHMEN